MTKVEVFELRLLPSSFFSLEFCFTSVNGNPSDSVDWSNIMAQQPFWIDDLFEDGPDNFEKKLLAHPRFKAAVAKAKAAFLEAEATLAAEPDIIGCVPAQDARNAFIESMGLEIHYSDE